MYKQIINYLETKNIAIVGFGKEGKSTYNFIRKYLPNKSLAIIDNNGLLLEQNEYLSSDKNLKLILGANSMNNLEIYDLIIKSPGVKFKDLDISKFDDKITSQLELILQFFRENVIGITGTKGKSTTTSLITKILKDQGKDAYLLGNIGIPIFDYVSEFTNDSILVIEMAALQLEYVKHSPHIGIILNLFEEHIDFFGTKENYFLSKMNMFKFQSMHDYGLYISSNNDLNSYVKNGNYKTNLVDIDKEITLEDGYMIFDGEKIYNTNDERLLLGSHNLSNIRFALYVSELLELDLKETIKTINSFLPLEHRMEFVGVFNGIKFYNDAIATIPDATINAIETLKPDTLIFGGMDRGIDYTILINYFNNCNVSNFICMPETGYKIGNQIKNKRVFYTENLKDAVSIAKEITKGICVMSPAAPSYNAFKNFEEKGKLYKQYIKEG